MTALLGCIVATKDASAAPKRVCEEWRDYNFNAETGDFIEWVGDPYWICFDASGPEERATRPKSPEPDKYNGGVPIPELPTPEKECIACTNRYDLCLNEMDRGIESCMVHYENVYRRICTKQGKNRDGSKIKPDKKCLPARDPKGKPIDICVDFSIDNCIDGYRETMPAVSTETNASLSITAFFPRIGEMAAKLGGKTMLSWPGGTGFRAMCTQAGVSASETCAAGKTSCRRKAGGCR